MSSVSFNCVEVLANFLLFVVSCSDDSSDMSVLFVAEPEMVEPTVTASRG